MTISYTPEAKYPLLDTGASNFGAVINGIFTSLDKGLELTFIAGENLLQYDTVYISGVNVVKKADADDTAERPAAGMAMSAVSLGAEVKVRMLGWVDYNDTLLGGALGATAGNLIYLSTTAGRLSIAPYSLFPQVVGIAKTSTVSNITRLFICPGLHNHQLLDATSSPTFAGLTLTGFSGVLKATAGVLAGNAVHADLGSIGPNDHHNQVHALVGSDHTASGLTIGHILRATAADAFGFGTITASVVSDFVEAAQDAVGGILTDSSSIDFTYDDGAGTITAVVLPGGVNHNSLLNVHQDVNTTASPSFVRLSLDQASTTGGVPVLQLDQADVSEEFIRYIGTSANEVLTQSLVEAVDVSTATLVGYKKIYVVDDGNQITDGPYYVPFYTLA